MLRRPPEPSLVDDLGSGVVPGLRTQGAAQSDHRSDMQLGPSVVGAFEPGGNDRCNN